MTLNPIPCTRAQRQTPLALAATLALIAVLSACGAPAEDVAAEDPAATEPAAADPMANVVTYDPAVLDDPSRTDDDRYRDEGFKPLEVYGFFGVDEGMVVGDLWTSRMYNAHILGHLVGETGMVIATGHIRADAPERYLQRSRDAFASRTEAGAPDNIEFVDSLADVADESLDMLITVRNYHDIGEAEVRVAFLPELMRVLKPGGILGVVDAHTDRPDERDESVHRINEDLASVEITSGGFELVDTSDVLYNPEDTFDFDGREDDAPIHRYFIHRFVHKYRKPGAQ